MLSHRMLLSGAIILGSAWQAAAAPATDAQADAIAKGIMSYIGSRPGVVTVKPSGEAYDVIIDLAPYKEDAAKEGVVFELSALHYKVTDAGNGTWRVEEDEPFAGSLRSTAATSVPGSNVDVKFAMGRVKSSSVYDAVSQHFTQSVADVENMSLDETIVDANGTTAAVKYKVQSLHHGFNASAKGEGVDGKSTAEMLGLSETVDVNQAGLHVPMSFQLVAAKASQTIAFSGLKLADFEALVRFVVDNAKTIESAKQQNELRKLAADALPLFDSLVADAGMEKLTISSSGIDVGLEKASVNVAMSGLVNNAALSEGFVVERVTLPAGLVPAYADELIPTRLAFDVKVAGFNLGDVAKLFIAEADLSKRTQPELESKLGAIALPQGKFTVSTSATQVTGKNYDVSLSGEMDAPLKGSPTGKAVVKAKGLDEVVKALQMAPPEQGTAQAVAGILMAKGFGKVEGDTVTWNIDAQPGGAVFVNSVDISKLAGSTPQQ